MKEVFKASHPDHLGDWKEASYPSILPLWWLLWIVAGFLGQAILRTTLQAETLEQIIASSWITFASDALDLPLGLVAITLVTNLQTWQSEKHSRLAAAAT
jgi:hypothetical protein